METVVLTGFYKNPVDSKAIGFEEKAFPIEKAQAIFDNYFGVPSDCNCGRKPRLRNKFYVNQDMYYAIAENSEYGLTDCGKIEKGGEYFVNTQAIAIGKPIKKPTKPSKKAQVSITE